MMKKQIIVAIGREHGSGGHYIADMIARELGVKLYDKDSIETGDRLRAATARSSISRDGREARQLLYLPPHRAVFQFA